MQEMVEFREGLIKASWYTLFAINLLTMFHFGMETWDTYHAADAARSQYEPLSSIAVLS